MLNQHDVKAHNANVALKETNRKVDAIANATDEAIRRFEKPAIRSTLPTCKPEARAPRKIYMGGKVFRANRPDVSSAFPQRDHLREYVRGERG
jgi:hypothetical protein